MADTQDTVKEQSVVDFGVESEQPVDFGIEAKENTQGNVFGKEVSAKDIFELGKKILLAILILFIFISSVRISLDPKDGPKEVWEFSKVFLSSIVSLVLGYYFGEKKK